MASVKHEVGPNGQASTGTGHNGVVAALPNLPLSRGFEADDPPSSAAALKIRPRRHSGSTLEGGPVGPVR